MEFQTNVLLGGGGAGDFVLTRRIGEPTEAMKRLQATRTRRTLDLVAKAVAQLMISPAESPIALTAPAGTWDGQDSASPT